MSFIEEALRRGRMGMEMGAEIQDGPNSTLTDALDPTSVPSAVQAAANAVITDASSTSGEPNALITAFQTAYNATGPSTPLDVDGRYGPNTAAALANYGTAPAVGGGGGGVTVQNTSGSGGQLVDRVATPIAPQALANALATMWPVVVGGVAPAGAIQLLLAQSDFETGTWNACWNWNLGNAKHVPGDGTDWFVMTATEGEDGHMVKSMFRSYPTLQDGTKAYLTLLYKRFSAAWPYVMSGDVTNFVQTLKSHGYFTGKLDEYLAGVKARLTKYTSIVPTVEELKGAAVVTTKVAAIGYGGYIIGGSLFLTALYLFETFFRRK